MDTQPANNVKRYIVLGVVLLVVLGFTVTSIVQWVRRGTSSSVKPAAIVHYTSRITGLSATDLPGQDAGTVSNTLSPPTASIEGADALYDSLDTDQAIATQDILSDFLMAHSGLDTVHAGIKTAKMIQLSTTHWRLTLLVIKPQATYQVDVQFANLTQTIPTVTFKRLEQ